MDLIGTIKYCITQKKDMHIENDNIILNSNKYNGDVKTSFKSSNGEYIKLKDIFFAVNEGLKHESVQYSIYYKEAKEKKFTPLIINELESLIKYVKGINKECDFIDKTANTSITPLESNQDDKIKTDLPLIDKILSSEIRTVTTNKLLRGNDELSDILAFYNYILMESTPKKVKRGNTNKKWQQQFTGGDSIDVEGSFGTGNTTVKRQKIQISESSALPIILFPPPHIGLLNIFNAKILLTEGRFVPADELSSDTNTNELTIIRKIRDKEITYRLIDSAFTLKKNDWNYVIAVVTCGNVWEFHDYLWTDPVNVFDGSIYIYYI